MELDLVAGAPASDMSRLFARGGVKRQDLINFCFHLEQLSSAGVPIVEGLADLRDSIENPRFREVVSGLMESIQGGQSLSQTLTDYPNVFSKVFVSLVRSGEQTGKLPEVLKSLTESLKWEDELAAQTKKLAMYPAFVGGVVVIVTFFLMIYLVPQMTAFIRNMGQAIPLQTRILLAVSGFFVNYWWAIVAAPFVAWGAEDRHPHQPERRACHRSLQDYDAARRPDPAQDHHVALRLELRDDVQLRHHGARFNPRLRGDRRQPAARARAAACRAGNRRRQKPDRRISRSGALPAARDPHAAHRREHRKARHRAPQRKLLL